ncbi:PD-(D/E)XK nuclease family protein, partial [Mitsuokella multacida]
TVLRGSVTQFEKFRQCPFAHFAAYGLKLQERREYQFRSMDLGQLLHAVLKEYGSIVKRDYANRWQDVPEEKRAALCEELVNTLAPRLQSEILLSRDNYRHLKKRIEKTAEQAVGHLSAWAAVSAFQPAFFEEAFGHPDDEVHLKPLPLGDGYALSFKGQIDRLDLHECAPYYLILDYKTGHVAINLFEVYYGLRLQLLVYMMVGRELLKEKGEKRLPAGILYAFLQNPLLQTRKKYTQTELEKRVNAELRMPGWVLADLDVAKAIDASFSFIKPGLSKVKDEKKKDVIGPDGKPVMDFDSNSRKRGYIRKPEEFELMLAYVDYILRDTGRAILGGDISASPYRLKAKKEQTACTYCEYHDVCGFDPDIEGYAYRDIGPEDDAVLEEKMASCTGKEDLLDAIHRGSEESD